MPGRPFQHVLETSSKLALEKALPADWILESRDHDYGIDLDIEVFDNGEATGLRIPVQLKGQQDSGSPARVKLKKTSISYWKESSSPVVVVVWDEKTDTLWWEWQYLLDTSKTKSTAVKVNVVVGRKWGASTPEEIRREAQAHKDLMRGNYVSPLPLKIVVEHDLRDNAPVTRLIIAKLRGILLTRPEVIVSSEDHLGELIIALQDKQIAMRLRGAPGVVLHFNKAFPKDDNQWDELASSITTEILSAVVTLVGPLGMRPLADHLLGRVAGQTQLLLSEKGLARSLGQLAQASNIDGFTSLFVRAITHPDPLIEVTAWQSLAFFSDVIAPEDRMKLVASIRDNLPENDSKSRSYYTLGQVVRNDDLHLALQLFAEAAQADPVYRERAYWWSDQGAMYFNAREYEQAIHHYEAAVNLGEEKTRYLLADALLLAGRLDESLEEFSKASAREDEDLPEWRIKRAAFAALRAVLSIEFGEEPIDPDMIPDMNLGLDIDLGPNPRKFLVSLLREDFRNPDILGALSLYLYEAASAGTYVTICFAFMSGGNTVAWTMALEACFDTHPELLSDLAICAMQQCGEQLLEYQAIEGGASSVVHDALMQAKQPPRPFTVREVNFGETTFREVLF